MEPDRKNLMLVGIATLAIATIVIVAIASNHGDGTTGAGDTIGLDGTSWIGESIVVGGTAVPPVEGATITADFADGQVTGSAGCNNYFGPFETDGDTLRVGPLGATRRLCPEPPGTDEQEAAYLAVLGSAERWSIEGDRLTFESAGGQIVYRAG